MPAKEGANEGLILLDFRLVNNRQTGFSDERKYLIRMDLR
jgi:hypothetical protein